MESDMESDMDSDSKLQILNYNAESDLDLNICINLQSSLPSYQLNSNN